MSHSEHRKDFFKRITYFIILLFFYIAITAYIKVPLKWISLFIYSYVILVNYLLDSINLTGGRPKKQNLIYLILFNLLIVFLHFIFTKDIDSLKVEVMFLGVQLILVYFYSKISVETKKIFVYGNDNDAKKIELLLNSNNKYMYAGQIEDSDNISNRIEKEKIGLIVLSKSLTKEVEEQLISEKIKGFRIQTELDFLEEVEGRIHLDKLNDEWVIKSKGFDYQNSDIKLRIKRAFDISLAFVIGTITFPIMLLAAIIVRLESPGPIIYSQKRVGLNGEEFQIYKFRSMRNDAEKSGAKWAEKNDPRVTKFGNFMRKTRIDELPQLWNVLKNEMSFIGPRPERKVFIEELEKVIPYYDLRHFVKPGLTGWAQVMYPYGASVEDAKNKLEFDLFYVKNQTLILDLIIMFKTAKVVIFGKGR